MKYLKDYNIPEWIYDELKREVTRVFSDKGVIPVKGKTKIDIVDSKSLASDTFKMANGFFNDKDYDKKTELEIFPLYMVDGYEAAYEVNLEKKTITNLKPKYEDIPEFHLKFLKKNISKKIKYLIFSVYDKYGLITYIHKV